MKTFDTYGHPSHKSSTLIPLVKKNLKEKHRKNLTKMRTESDPHKRGFSIESYVISLK